MLSQLLPKILLDSKVVKIDPKIIILLSYSKSVTHSVSLLSFINPILWLRGIQIICDTFLHFPFLLVHCLYLPLNHKRTTSSLATPILYVAKKNRFPFRAILKFKCFLWFSVHDDSKSAKSSLCSWTRRVAIVPAFDDRHRSILSGRTGD